MMLSETPAYPARVADVRDLGDFVSVLDALGVTAGSTVYVHSGMTHFGTDVSRALSLLHALHDRVGQRGSIFMPSFTFHPEEWQPQPGALFDVRRTPSRCGLVSELFRREAAVRRSEHFYFPVSGSGPLAEDVLAGQLHNDDLFGDTSVFGRLVASNALLVGLGVSPNASSFGHLPDWLLRDKLPEGFFLAGSLHGFVRTYDGVLHATTSVAINPRIRLSFAPWQMMDDDSVLGTSRNVVLSLNPQAPIYAFSYSLRSYVLRALEVGTVALSNPGVQPPWLKPGTFALLDDTPHDG
jgi:hypothetical protein